MQQSLCCELQLVLNGCLRNLMQQPDIESILLDLNVPSVTIKALKNLGVSQEETIRIFLSEVITKLSELCLRYSYQNETVSQIQLTLPIAKKHPWIRQLFLKYNERIKRFIPVNIEDFQIELPLYVPAMAPIDQIRCRYYNHFDFSNLVKKKQKLHSLLVNKNQVGRQFNQNKKEFSKKQGYLIKRKFLLATVARYFKPEVKQFKLFESFKEHVEEKMKRSTAVMAIQPEKKIPSPEMFVGKLNGTTKKQKEDDWKTKMKNQQKQREKYEKMMRRQEKEIEIEL